MQNNNVIGQDVKVIKTVQGIPVGQYHVTHAVNFTLYLRCIESTFIYQLSNSGNDGIRLLDFLEII